MKRLIPLPALLLWFGLLAGCASYDARVDKGRSLAEVKRYFVLSNHNDNHALDAQIAAALQARGFAAETGPLTMMPEETQAIVSYQDHWAWDFGDHLDYLQIAVRDRKNNQPYATATFSTRVPTSKPPAGIVDGLMAQLLPQKS